MPCVYWGDFVDLPTCSTVKCVRFQAVKGTMAHNAFCPLVVAPMYLSWLLAGITVTYTPSNGDQMVIGCLVISSFECGQYVFECGQYLSIN